MNNTMEMISGMTFGCELEYEGITCAEAARAVAETVGGRARYIGTHLGNWEIETADGRKWQVVRDGSLHSGCETVTPVMTLADMDTLQAVVRALRRAGARAAGTCGLHIHVGAAWMGAAQLRNLVRFWYNNENIIIEGCATRASRLNQYTHPMPRSVVGAIRTAEGIDFMAIGRAYYGGQIPANVPNNHYHLCRYRDLNLHNLYNGNKGTVEFRLFEATTHAGEVKADVLFALSVVAKAKTAKFVQCTGERYVGKGGKADMGLLFQLLGWRGEDFKVARHHFLKRALAERLAV